MHKFAQETHTSHEIFVAFVRVLCRVRICIIGYDVAAVPLAVKILKNFHERRNTGLDKSGGPQPP